MIFADSLPAFKSFLGKAADACADLAHALAFVACFLLPAAARRSVKAAARSIRSDLRDAGNLLRFLAGSKTPALLLAAAQTRLLEQARGRGRLHLLLLDSTQHSQHGEHQENTFSRANPGRAPEPVLPGQPGCKRKKVHKKGCHTFVFALLLCPCGLRVPYWLPFYTKGHCKTHGMRHRTQTDLAAQLVDGLPLAPSAPVVVVGDTAFDAEQIRRACARRGYRWVVPVNPERVLAGPKPRPKVLSLIGRLKAEDFRETSFRLDEGPLAPMARVSPGRVRSSKHQRVYWAHVRTADVHSVGRVTLLFSNKKRPAGTSRGVAVQKVLMSDAADAGAEELLRWYALRWQIEVFFKEMKGELGMCQYRTGSFDRVVGWVNLSVLAYCCLEHDRLARERDAGKGERPYWRADIEGLIRLARTADGRRRLNDILRRGYDDPADPHARRAHA